MSFGYINIQRDDITNMSAISEYMQESGEIVLLK